jgi:hypothetical protein
MWRGCSLRNSLELAMLRRRTLLAAGATMTTARLLAQPVAASTEEVRRVKARIVALAQSFAGQGDPDFARQNAFAPLIAELLSLRPQAPVADRLPRLFGPWRQVWGPYDYRGNSRGVDAEIDIDEIYQVVLPGGVYYNVTPLARGSDRNRERIALLRGEYRPDPDQPDVLLVRFTRYPGLSTRPTPGPALYELPALVESRTLEPDISIVPTWLVRLFFGGGALKEVYTDDELRILYGGGSARFDRPALYVMTRPTP